MFIVVAPFVIFAADAKGEGDKDSHAEIEGKWRIIDKRLDEIGLIIEWEFTADEVIVRDAKTGEDASRATYTTDKSKNPAWITVDVSDRKDGKAGDKRLGIYRIENGELHLKQEIVDGGKRPTEFKNGFRRYKRVPQNPNAKQGGGPKR